MDIAYFVYCSSADEHLGHFQFLGVIYDAAMNMCVQAFVGLYQCFYFSSTENCWDI